MNVAFTAFLFSLFFICFSPIAKASANYVVTLDEKNGLIDVKACFEHLPHSLVAGQRKSHRYLNWFKLGKKPLQPRSNRLKIGNSDETCITYQVNLNLMLKDRQAWNEGDSWMVSNRAWLWQPEDKDGIVLKFFFKNPTAEQHISVPWPKHEHNYIAAKSPPWWTSRMAFGKIFRQDIKINDNIVRLAIVGIPAKQKQLELAQWIQHTASTVAQVGGQFPVNQAQALVLPISSRPNSGPVPWGEVQRNGLPSVHLFVNPTLPMEAFYQDWTATHEFSHLLLPKVNYQDRWISEGLATYYQYLVMSRSGVISHETAWEKMTKGFQKGQKSASGYSLRKAKGTKHTYWGGASIFLLADITLRKNGQSLDQVLGKLNNCCMPSNKNWSAEEFMAKLDQLSNTQVFSTLLKEQAQSTRFPLKRSFVQKEFNQLDEDLKTLF